MNCQNCNEPLALYWKFCPVCGETQQINDEDIKKSPNDKSFLNNYGVTVLGRKTVMLEGDEENVEIEELLNQINTTSDGKTPTDEQEDYNYFSGFHDIFGGLFGNNDNNSEMDKYYRTHLNKDSKFNPSDGLSYYHRAMFYKEHRAYSRAITDFTKALQFSPDSDTILYERAEAYRAKNNATKEDYAAAIADYTCVIELNPEYAFAFYRRGETYFLNNDADNAINDYNKALSIKPDFLAALLLRGDAYREQEEYDLAIKDYTEYFKLIPAVNRMFFFPVYSDYPYYQRGHCYYQLNEYSLAKEDFDQELKDQEINYNADAYFWRGRIHIKEENWLAAIDDFTEVIKRNADNPYNFIWRGNARYKIGNTYDAKIDYQEALKLDPALDTSDKDLFWYQLNDK